MVSTQSTPPSRLARLIRSPLRWLWRLLLVLVLLALLGIGVIYLWVVPRLDQWRPQLIAYVQQQTGLDVEIGSLQASHSTNWLPVLEIQNARLTSPQAPWQLAIDKAQLGLSWQLLRGQPLGNVLIEQPRLQWTSPAPTSQAKPESAEPIDPSDAKRAAFAQAWQWLLKQPSIRIVNGSVDWRAPSAAESSQSPASSLQLSHIDLELSYHPLRDFNQLDLRFEAPQLLSGAAELQLQGKDWQRWGEQGWAAWSTTTGSWRLNVADLDVAALSEWLGQLTALQPWPKAEQGQLSLRSQGQVNNGEVRPASFEIEAQELRWPLTEHTRLQLAEIRLAGALTAQRPSLFSAQPRVQWQLDLQPGQFSANGQSWRSQALQLALTTAAPANSASSNTAQSQTSSKPGSMPIVAASLSSPGLDLEALSALLQGIVDGAEPAATAQATASSAPSNATTTANEADAPKPLAAAAQQLGQWRQQLSLWQPSGQLQDIQIGWQAPASPAPERGTAAVLPPWPWSIKAGFQQLSVGISDAAASSDKPPPFGIRNLSGRIYSSPAGGSASLQVEQGSLQLPTVFDAGPMAIDRLRTQLQWTLADDGGIAVNIDLPELANPDAAGSATIMWRSSSPAEIEAMQAQTEQPVHALPGFLDLKAALTRADATAVWRYLPHSIPADVRHYVQEAILGGRSNNVEFEVRGDLKHFPFDARQRDPATQRYPATAASSAAKPSNAPADATAPRELFRISADLQQVQFRYVPHYLLGAATPALTWPDLQGVNARLDFVGNRMDLAVQSAQLQAAPKVRVSSGKAWIDDLLHAQVGVDVRAAGPLADQLQVLSTTPVARMTDHVMDNLQGTGNAAFRLQLAIPLESKHAEQLKVAGEVQLKDSALQWWPQVPSLDDLQGVVRFTDKGFSAKDIQGQALGGPVTLNVAMADHVNGQPTEISIDAQGQLTATGLQQYASQALGNGDGKGNATAEQWLAALNGQTDYKLQVQTVGQRPFVSLDSSLQGLASALPYPLDKTADEARPLRLSHARPDANGIEQIALTLGDRIDARYQLQETHVAKALPAEALTEGSASNTAPVAATTSSLDVQSGQLLIGQFSADEKRLPAFIPNTFASAPVDTKVQAIVARERWDVSEWLPWLVPEQDNGGAHTPSAKASTAGPSWAEQLIPDVWYGHFEQLQWGKMTLHNAQIQAYQSLSSNAAIWTSRFKADETQGTIEYHPQYLEGTGLLRGKIDYLELPAQFGQEDATATESAAADPQAELADNSEADASAPSALANVRHLPTVDIEVGRLLFASRDWGKVAIQAMNRVVNGHPNEWIINYLTVEVPEGRLTAKGSWQNTDLQNRQIYFLSGRKKMDMQFTLDMFDAGRLLSRMGMPNVLYAGNGQLNGRLSWQGSPLHLDIPSLSGDFSLDVSKGQFLKASAGAGRLLGVMSLQALPRRLTLDFRDIFSEGFAFDFVRGDVHLAAGVASTNNLQMKGVNAGVVLEGNANIVQETQDITAVVVPELDAMTASLVATAINPAIGAGTFLAQFFFSKPLAEAATQEFHIQGSWSDPVVTRTSKRATKPPPLE